MVLTIPKEMVVLKNCSSINAEAFFKNGFLFTARRQSVMENDPSNIITTITNYNFHTI